SDDVIVPEVWGDAASAEFVDQARVAGSAAVLVDDTLAGQPGERVHFPQWENIGDLDDLDEGVPMVPVKMGQTDFTAVIKEAGKAVEITDKAALTGIGNAQDEAVRQFGVAANRKVDADLIAAALAAATGDEP